MGAAVGFLLLCPLPALADGSVWAPRQSVPSYEWWHRLSMQAKEASVISGVRGIQIGWAHAYAAGRGDAGSSLVDSARAGESVSSKAFGSLLHYPSRNPPEFSHTAAYYVKRIDSYYAQYPGARKQVFESPLFACLADRPLMPCSEAAMKSPP